jgi:cytochrome P450
MTTSGTPRALTEDDTYGEFVFEKGTVFSYNHYGLSHDGKEFSQHEAFLPERFLNDDLQDLLKGHLGFGAGT